MCPGVLEVGVQHDQVTVNIDKDGATEKTGPVVDEPAVDDGDLASLDADGAALADETDDALAAIGVQVHLATDDLEGPVALCRRVRVPVLAGDVLREGARVHDQPSVVGRQHQDGGAGVHRHVPPEVAVLDMQRLVVADCRQSALVVHEATIVDPHVSFIGCGPVFSLCYCSLLTYH